MRLAARHGETQPDPLRNRRVWRAATIFLTVAALLLQIGTSDDATTGNRVRDLGLCLLVAAATIALTQSGWRIGGWLARHVRSLAVLAALLVLLKTAFYDLAWTLDDTGVPGETPSAPWTWAEVAAACYLTAAVVTRRSPYPAVALLIAGAFVDCWLINTRGYTLPLYLLSANLAVVAAVLTLRAYRGRP